MLQISCCWFALCDVLCLYHWTRWLTRDAINMMEDIWIFWKTIREKVHWNLEFRATVASHSKSPLRSTRNQHHRLVEINIFQVNTKRLTIVQILLIVSVLSSFRWFLHLSAWSFLTSSFAMGLNFLTDHLREGRSSGWFRSWHGRNGGCGSFFCCANESKPLDHSSKHPHRKCIWAAGAKLWRAYRYRGSLHSPGNSVHLNTVLSKTTPPL